ncbi:peptidylprolyl isomerase [Sansalvadorimonas sp. 2012CJ34-2]|uniref:Peptidyl-prolyl cis-trans isomerase n=1 Tax=Parendozoicomonas callyspongiae TaxID=2942213 RepID=A0ABT0PLD6_9GAMM|nr:peptidylprolyl isomerase [Sansalvadorimonas sp. 2012CJ34-2]MCL6272076.1 peptidylprolyl isomerase [Sansalvadorimonas sp. 2012CJ34-2]
MKIADKKVVSIHYTLKNDNGDVLDSSAGHEPLAYLHGMGSIIAGLEAALKNKEKGDKFSIKVEPAEGYGEYDESLVNPVPPEQFGDHEVEVGMQFHADTAVGPRIVTVVGIHEEAIIIDANHELAGENLNFDVEVMDVRDATEEELDHGHAHTAGCNH